MNQLRKSVVLFSIACAIVAIGAGPPDVNGGSLVDSGTRLGPSDPGGADLFGSNVAIEKDLAVIGAANADNSFGAAYVFGRKNGVWVERTRLVPIDRSLFSEFGENVSISGNTIAIGAPSKRTRPRERMKARPTFSIWTANFDGNWGPIRVDSRRPPQVGHASTSMPKAVPSGSWDGRRRSLGG